MPDGKIVEVVETKGTKRVYKMEDGSVIERDGGTISWRNNNPGNLTYGPAAAADEDARNKTLEKAKQQYGGVVGIDDRGYIIFENQAAGRAAQIKIADNKAAENKDWTLYDYLKFYARDDHSGIANHDAYLKKIAEIGKENGVDLSRDRKLSELNEREKSVLVDAMKVVESHKVGDSKMTSWPGMENLSAYKIVIPAGRDMDDKWIYATMCADIAQRNLFPITQQQFDRVVEDMVENMKKIPKPIITPAIPENATRERGTFETEGRTVDGYRMNVTVAMQQDFIGRVKALLQEQTETRANPDTRLTNNAEPAPRLQGANMPPLLNDPAHPNYELFRQARAGIDAPRENGPTLNDAQKDSLAASLATAALNSGAQRIDRVWLSDDGKRVFATQGSDPASPAAIPMRVDLDDAKTRTVEQSTRQADAIAAAMPEKRNADREPQAVTMKPLAV